MVGPAFGSEMRNDVATVVVFAELLAFFKLVNSCHCFQQSVFGFASFVHRETGFRRQSLPDSGGL